MEYVLYNAAAGMTASFQSLVGDHHASDAVSASCSVDPDAPELPLSKKTKLGSTLPKPDVRLSDEIKPTTTDGQDDPLSL